MSGAREPDFTEKFWPQDNPFKIAIARLIPPRTVDDTGPTDAFLIKLKYVVCLPLHSEEDREMFQRFVRMLEQKKAFCGMWTPELSEPYYDEGEASLELTSYLRKGSEDKILHLDQLARSYMERRPTTDDGVLVEQFLIQLRNGAPLKEAVLTAEKETKDLLSRGRRAETEIESDGLATGSSLASPGPLKGKVHRPPPGPTLQRSPPAGPGLPEVPRAEEPPPKSEVHDSLQLASKDRDSELDVSTDPKFEINIGRKKEREAG
jgi:hypothetical protein